MRNAAIAPRAVLFDALGTLVELDQPVERLVAELGARGVDAGASVVAHALRAEIAFYRAEHHAAVDADALELLRDACAVVFGHALGPPARGIDPAVLREALLAGLRFRPFDDVAPALERLRAAGVALAIVSNWDLSLEEVLRDTGLRAYFEVVVVSATERSTKPDPRLFLLALARLGDIPASAALHVGDDLIADIQGARSAGVAAVLIDRAGELTPPVGVSVIRTLAQLAWSGR